MSDKRHIPVGFKLSDSDKKLADSVSAKYGHKPGSLAGVLLREFLKAHSKHGNSIRFPPVFDFYESNSIIEERMLKVQEVVEVDGRFDQIDRNDS